MLEARQKNGDAGETHLLHERLVFSYLAYKARHQLAVSARQISDQTRLHHQSVTNSLKSLDGFVTNVGNKWLAQEPPEDWFALRTCDNEPDHWADKFAYTMLLRPKLRTNIVYPQTTRRFGLNHAAIYSYLVNRGKRLEASLIVSPCQGRRKCLVLADRQSSL